MVGTPAFAQERQQALKLLRGSLQDKGNFIVLTWGSSEVHWPDPIKLKEALSSHTDATYKDVLEHLPPDESSQEVRAIIQFYFRILKDESVTDQMELLEG